MASREPVVVGRIRRPWGLRGEVIVDVWTDWPEIRFAKGARIVGVVPDGCETLLVVAMHRPMAKGDALRFEGFGTVEEAGRLRGLTMTLPEGAPRPELQGDEIHHAELAGTEVVDLSGRRLGVVTRVEELAAGDYVLVRTEGGEILLPLSQGLCRGIDRERGVLVVDPPRGLFEPDEAVEVDPHAGEGDR